MRGWGSGCDEGLGFRVSGLGFRVSAGLGFRVQGLGLGYALTECANFPPRS